MPLKKCVHINSKEQVPTSLPQSHRSLENLLLHRTITHIGIDSTVTEFVPTAVIDVLPFHIFAYDMKKTHY